jgi:A/G-specific adenine glycosylase
MPVLLFHFIPHLLSKLRMKRQLVPLKEFKVRKLRRALLNWYGRNQRELPWRRDADPYRVWVSEIMLQQTRVGAVLDHYKRFLERFPNFEVLAAAHGPSVLAAWSGLGYYHRARRMHQAAKMIVRAGSGCFPRTAEQWRELPGIGRYTAAAIASIAFGEAAAVVDGNVERVLERMFGPPQKKETAWQRAAALLDRQRPGDFNQAMMELGATLCTPRAPQCPLCPLNSWCKSRGAAGVRPQPERKRKRLYYGLARKGGAVLLVQRPANASLMAGMWELPTVPRLQTSGRAALAKLRHSITDTDYEIAVLALSPERFPGFEAGARWFVRKQWEALPLTGLARKVLRRLQVESGLERQESNGLR